MSSRNTRISSLLLHMVIQNIKIIKFILGTPITTYQEQVRPISFIFRTIENDQNCVAIQIADELN